MSSSAPSTYAFAVTPADLIDAQLSCIQDCYDPASRAVLDDLGVSSGWRCWEVGVGAGSIAAWLADRVGPQGSVLATDLNLARVPEHHRIRAHRHDVVREEPMEEGFDLIHARLLLQHLPERYKVAARLADALRPGGWLVLEDFDCGYLPTMAGDPDQARLHSRVTGAMLDALTQAGADVRWGARTYRVAAEIGLERAVGTTYALASPGGSPGARLFAVNARQLDGKLRASGLSGDDLDDYQRMLADPAVVVASYLLTSVRARRPEGD